MREEVLKAVASVGDRLTLADSMRETLYVDDRPVRHGPISVEASDSEPSVMLSCFVREPLGPEDAGSLVRLSVEVGGLLFDAYIGRIVFARLAGGAEIECQTPAYEWSRTPVGADQEWLNTPATLVAFSALSALSQMYRSIEIPQSVAEPTVTALGSDRVGTYDYISDAVELAEGGSERLRRVFDTALSVATAYPETPVSGEPLWTVREGEDCPFGAVEVEPVDGERYYSVAVMRRTEAGVTEELARVKVENGDARVNPASCLVLEYSEGRAGETAEERSGVVTSAYQMAFNEAMRRGKDARKLSVPLIYRPYWIERGSLVEVETRRFTGQFPEDSGVRGSVVSTYLVRVVGYTWGEGQAEAKLEAEGILVSEVFAAEAGAFAARLDAPTTNALWGIRYDGEQYVDTRLPWVRHENGSTYLDTEIAGFHKVDIQELTEGRIRVRETA